MLKKNQMNSFLMMIFFLNMLSSNANSENKYPLKKYSQKMKDFMLDIITTKANINDLSNKDMYYLSLLILDLAQKKQMVQERNTVYWYSRQG